MSSVLRLLLIDDDEAIRGLIKAHLSPVYEVIETGIPESAIAMAIERKPDAILLDLSMPSVSGFELCQTLASLNRPERIPIFIVSGLDERNRAFCQRLGASGYFTKPIDFEQLKTVLAWALSSKKEEAGSKKDERRTSMRVRLSVILNIRGSKNGKRFQARATTEDVSTGGFLCTCPSQLEEGSAVEVSLHGETEYHLGQARLVRVVKTDPLHPRYGFQFIGTSDMRWPALTA